MDDLEHLTQPATGDQPALAVSLRMLVLAHGRTATRRATFVLDDRPLTIGRDDPVEGRLALGDPEVSRRHAEAGIDATTETVWIRDLGSRNGTFVGGERIEQAQLAAGAVIRVGRTLLVHVEDLAHIGQPLRQEAPPLLGPSLVMQQLRGDVELVAPRAMPVVVLGETGVGKELVAQEIHARSGRTGAFVPVNCAALPPNLAESELFGHAAGAFTGALARGAEGLFAAARGGTIFLDEIAEMPLDVQAKLLRVLATGEIRPVGATEARRVDVRVIAATHRDLAALVATGGFRADLFARLSGWTLRVRPLRERRDDVLPLARAFLRRHPGAPMPSADVAEALLLHDWPFNVRELELMMAAAAARAGTSQRLLHQHLPDEIAAPVARRGQRPVRPDRPLPQLVPRDIVPTHHELCLVLERMGGNVATVAEYFGKDRQQIYRWARRLGIELDGFRKLPGPGSAPPADVE